MLSCITSPFSLRQIRDLYLQRCLPTAGFRLPLRWTLTWTYSPSLLHFWSKYPTHVSGGEDGIHIRLLRALIHTALPHQTLRLFKICCLLGVTPSSWNVSVIHPIPKKDTTTINTFRPISLTLMLRRSFEKLFLAISLVLQLPGFTTLKLDSDAVFLL